MAWSESKAWMKGTLNQKLYQALLDDATAAPARNAKRKKIVHPEEMPWEMARQGLLKHLVNEAMNTRMETVDAYMQIIPPGSRSGKHRHLAEECLYVVEGHGYDLHQDCDVEITDTYHWTPQEEVKRYEWEAGDVIYVPPNTIHQHFNASADKPGAADFDHQPHLQGVRTERPRADRGRARVRSGGGIERRSGSTATCAAARAAVNRVSEATWPRTRSSPTIWRRNSPPRRRRRTRGGCVPRGSTSSARSTCPTCTPSTSSRGRGAADAACFSTTTRRARRTTATCARFRPARSSRRSGSCTRK